MERLKRNRTLTVTCVHCTTKATYFLGDGPTVTLKSLLSESVRRFFHYTKIVKKRQTTELDPSQITAAGSGGAALEVDVSDDPLRLKRAEPVDRQREIARLEAIRAEEEELDLDESDSIQASDHSFGQIEMDEQEKGDNLEPIEISEIEGGVVDNEEDVSENDSDATDDVKVIQVNAFHC